MRLFILDDTEVRRDGSFMSIDSSRVIRHAHVIRLSVGEECAIQVGEMRHLGVLEHIGKRQLTMRIHNTVSRDRDRRKASVCMAVALPNTGAKLDLIVEKLTEVGVDQIVFFAAARSQLRDLSDKKREKLRLRALEASEQSNSWIVPEIVCVQSLEEVLMMEGRKIMFDKEKEGGRRVEEEQTAGCAIGLVGPEGGRIDEEYAQMSDIDHMSLGETILRMETAAIVGGWQLVQGVGG